MDEERDTPSYRTMRDPKNTGRIERMSEDIKAIKGQLAYLISEDELHSRLEAHVTYKALVPWGAAVVVATFAAVWAMNARTEARAEAVTSQGLASSRESTQKAVDWFGKTTEALQGDVTENRKEMRAFYISSRTGRRAAELERDPVPARLPTPPKLLEEKKP